MFSFQTVSISCSDAVKQRNLARVKNINNFDASYIEYALFSLFRIDILNYIKNKAILAKEFHIQPSELDAMPVWEFEVFMNEINNAVKEENDRNKQDMDKAGYDKMQKMSDPKYIERMQKNAMPKMPSIKMPKY